MSFDQLKTMTTSLKESFDDLKNIFSPETKTLKKTIDTTTPINDKLTTLEHKINQTDHKEQLKEYPAFIQQVVHYYETILTPNELNAIGDIFMGETLADQIMAFIEEQSYNDIQAKLWNTEPRDALQKTFDIYDGTTNIQTTLHSLYTIYTETRGTSKILTSADIDALTTHYKNLLSDTDAVQKTKTEYAQKLQTQHTLSQKKLSDAKKSYMKTKPVMTWYAAFDEIIDTQWLSLNAFKTAYTAMSQAKSKWLLQKDRYLTIVDYTKSKHEDRLYVVDTQNKTVILRSKAGHGTWSWTGDYIQQFSNTSWSKQTSAWLFKTAPQVERASHGRRSGLRLHGLEPWLNDKSASRGIFIHKAGVNSSEWCITIPKSADAEMINRLLAWGYPIYNYTNNNTIIAQSKLLNESSLSQVA